MNRCKWCGTEDKLMIEYHDKEWGVPVHDDKKLFEFIVLESAQAGLSWKTILHRREGYRNAFANFDYTKVAKFTQKDVEKLMQDSSIIRNRLKIEATINNAKCFMQVQKEFGSFDKYIWSFVKNHQSKTDAMKLKSKQHEAVLDAQNSINRQFLSTTDSNSKIKHKLLEFCCVKKPIVNNIESIKDYKATTKLSDEISKDLKKRGFKFMGSTIVYAHMQATGLVNDHENSCFRKKKC